MSLPAYLGVGVQTYGAEPDDKVGLELQGQGIRYEGNKANIRQKMNTALEEGGYTRKATNKEVDEVAKMQEAEIRKLVGPFVNQKGYEGISAEAKERALKRKTQRAKNRIMRQVLRIK